MLTSEQIAYVAGIIDCQGNIRSMTTDDGTVLPLVSISTPNVALANYLGHLTGIKPIMVNRQYTKHRCLEHCDKPHEHITSSTARWSVSGAKATVLLNAIKPYVQIQKSEIEELAELGLSAPKKKATPLKMMSLGWPLPQEWVA